MSTRTTTWVETEYHDTDLSSEMKRLLLSGFTGQIVLHVKRGRIMAVVQRERSVQKDTSENVLDRDTVLTSFSHT